MSSALPERAGAPAHLEVEEGGALPLQRLLAVRPIFVLIWYIAALAHIFHPACALLAQRLAL